MQPVLAEREVAAGKAGDSQLPPQNGTPPGDGAGPDGPAAAPRVCDTCGSTMDVSQDWCLECGTAAPGRLGTRPGLRAMATVAAATLVLAGGAVIASYAALSEDAKLDAGQPAPAAAGPVAQGVPDLPPASAPPAPTGAAGAVTGAAGLPQVTVPKAAAPVTPIAPPAPPAPAAPFTPPNTGGNTGTGTGTGADDTDTTTPEEDDTKDTTPSLTAISLGADTVSVYDPYKRVTAKSDPVDAYDGDRDTFFRITTADPGKPMGVGLVVDLEKTTKVRALELVTDTPGYRVELYGTRSSTMPPDILDARWDHYADRSRVDEGTKDGNVAGDDKDRISLQGIRDVRYLAIWITTPPQKGPTVRIQELNLFK